MKFVFKAKVIDSCICLVSIRKFEEDTWYHFKRKDWLLRRHIPIVQQVIGSKNFTSYRQITVNLNKFENVLEYFDAIKEKFRFNDYYLEKGNN